MQKHLRKSDIRDLNDKISSWDISIDKKAAVFQEDNIIFVDKQPFLFYFEEKFVPHLKLLLNNPFLPNVVVDAGAVKFMVSGADVMRPGITWMQDFEKDAIVVIIEETHKKPLAVGIALYSSSQIQEMDSGKVIKSIHFIGDEIWQRG